nr:hypothetical protein [Tanacetum cinerariifolium]
MFSIQKVLQNTVSVGANEREEAILLLSQCQEQDINRMCRKLGRVIKLCDDRAIHPITICNKVARRSHRGELFLPIEFAYPKGSRRNSVCIHEKRTEWKPTLSLVAFDVAVGYLPHLRRNGEEKVFCVMVVAGKENVEGEPVSKATDFLLVLAEIGERSNDDLGVRFGQLIALDGLVRVARVYGEVGMLAQAELYHLEYGLAASWEQCQAVMATYDAIIEGCTTDEIMIFAGSKRVLGITLVYLKGKDQG